MKMIHVITLFLVILGGLNLLLNGLGINLFGILFGAANLTILSIVIGASIVYHVLPLLKKQLAAL